MKIYEIQERAFGLNTLLEIWEDSVRATHKFLSDEEINQIKEYVPMALKNVEHLIIAENESGEPVGFMGVENNRLEMLFLSPTERGKGLGRQLLQYGIHNYAVQELTVNEQNPQAVGFYEHLGFQTYKRTELDEEGNPYPLLYMKLTNIRKAEPKDLSRIAEIYVFNNRINYYPIFKDPDYSFGELQVVSLIDNYFKKEEILENIYVFDDGIIKGFVQADGTEIVKLYVDPCLQSNGIGHELIEFAIRELGADRLWALEKNTRAISFYNRNGFLPTGRKKLEEDTTEYLVELKRQV